jgi:hypothetical protein
MLSGDEREPTNSPTYRGPESLGGGDNLIILGYPDILDDLGNDPR